MLLISDMLGVKQQYADLERTKQATEQSKLEFEQKQEATRSQQLASQQQAQILQEAFSVRGLQDFAKQQPITTQSLPAIKLDEGQKDATQPVSTPVSLQSFGVTKEEQQQAQGAYSTQSTKIADALTNASMSLFQHGQPAAAQKLLDDAMKIRKQVAETEKDQWTKRVDEIKFVSNAMNTVNDQASLTAARQALNALSPGAGDQMPSEYNAVTAPMIRRAALLTTTALQQTEMSSKLIDLKTQEQKNNLDIEEKKASIAHKRAQTAHSREGIKTPKANKEAIKAEDKLTAEQLRYNKALKALEGKADDMFGPAKEPGWFSGKGPSKRDEFIVNEKKKEQELFMENLAAVQQNAARKGVQLSVPELDVPRMLIDDPKVPTGAKPIKQGTPKAAALSEEQVMERMRTKNPGVSEAELRAYAKSKGYLQ